MAITLPKINSKPTALLAFGITTFSLCLMKLLSNLPNDGVTGSAKYVGGTIQMVISVFCFISGDTFGTTAFGLFSNFWFYVYESAGHCTSSTFPFPPTTLPTGGLAFAFSIVSFAFLMYLLLVRPTTVATIIIFALLIFFFVLDFVATLVTGDPGKNLRYTVNIIGAVLGAASVLFGTFEVINEVGGKDVMPLIPLK